jgi:hypothetical protein
MAGKLLQSALALLITLPLAKALSAGGVLSRASETLAVPGGPLIRETISAGGLPLAGWRHLPEIWLAGLACFGTFVLLTVLAALIRPKRRHPPDPPS